MKKFIPLILALAMGLNLFAQDKTGKVSKQQFILIIRSKADLSHFTSAAIQLNIKHWEAYMGHLAEDGKLAGGYRPGNTGETISKNKNIKTGVYSSGNEVISAFLIINAADVKEADAIAATCPVFELDGSIEIRPLMNTAG